ncbi:LPP20 family lipoprotein [Kaarinaea lacus]
MKRAMKNPFLFGMAVAVVLMAGGCASKDKPGEEVQPDWIVGESAQYPKSLYLTGQAAGETAELAKQYARADLAKVFEVKISETSRDVQIVEIQEGTATSQAQAERYISTHVNQILSGVEVADIWRDPETRKYHALVVLNRDKTARALREDIRNLDEATARNIQKAQQEIDRLRLAAHAYKAYVAQLERSVIQKKLRVVDPAGIGDPPRLELAKLKADYEQVLGRIHIIAQSSDEHIQDLVNAGISQSGFNADPKQPTRYILKASLETVPVIRRGDFFWQQAALNFQLQENNDSAKVRGSDRWEIKVSATDEGVLEKRLNDELGQFNTHKYRDMILKFALIEAK